MTERRRKIADLSKEERTKLETRLLQQRRTSGAKSAIPRRATVTPCRSSFSQTRLWFLDQFEPGSSVYNIPLTLRLKGVLDVGALEASLNALVARHEVLRTCFGVEAGDPVQVIAPTLTVPLPVDDLCGVPQAEREAQLQARVQAETDAPFDLAQGPLLRARLLQVGEKAHVLVLTVHHIISDGWSMGVLMRELSALYAACCQGLPSPLPELPIQYADYAIWQRDWLQGEVLEKQLSYWREQLKDLPVLDLPTDRPRPAMQSFRGAQLHFDLPADLTQGLEKLSQRAGVTLFMTLLAAFQVLLQRYTGQDDIVVGSPIAGRNKVDIEGLIGFFVNTLVLRTDLSGNPTFMELLGRVREVALGAYAHQELPFDRLMEELQPARDMSRNPLFQVMFVLQNAPRADLNLPGIQATLQPAHRATAKFDLTLSIIKRSDMLQGTLEYNLDLFDAVTVGTLAEHFQTLLAGIVAAPDQSVRQLPMLSEAERSRLLADWNTTALAYDGDQAVHQLIERQVDRTPAAVAVGFEDRSLSYQALDQQANQLAHHLQALGVGPDVLVGVALERSERMLVALLGVLKAGGAYVPMDPDYPQARLAYMLEHADVRVLLTEEAMLERLPEHTAQMVCLDRDWKRIGGLATSRPAAGVRPENLAYVIYTSGSTGKPKGVQVHHGAVVNFLTSMAHTPGLTARDVLLAVTTLSFDIAVLELYLPLTIGGRVQLVSREVAGDGEQLLRALKETSASVMQATPATWRLLLLAGWEGREGFKVLAGGEALPRDLVNELVDRAGGVWNMYGPTETTVWSTCEYVTATEGPVLIGRPIGNTQVYVLDADLQPVPVGVPGELYIGGRGVARGYLHAPDLTLERFVPDPFAAEPGGRLYRTGDQVRYRPDGRLEYLGRLDNQVKLRGFRIELGEIETVLSTHQALQQVVVAVREDHPGDARLVAYIVPLPGQAVTVTDVRKHLRRALPDYMIPQHVVELEAIPMTPSGKIDRKALPSPFDAAALDEDVYVAPGTETERTLAAIWQEVLGVTRVGIHDNFFDLGGHSLLATKGIARMNAVLHSEFPVVMFFEYPTIAEQVSRIAQEHFDDSDEELNGLLDELEGLSEEDQAALVFGKPEE
jgi:amino acid adenylation domain-containing protein